MEHTATVSLGGWRARLSNLTSPLDRLEDEELVARAQAGDVRAYEELVGRYERLVGRVLYRYAGQEVAVEDLMQETFLRAYDRLDTFNPEYRFKTWLLAIANNLGVDVLRRRRETVEFNPEYHSRVTRGPETAVQEAEQSERLQDAILSLPETYSQPLILRYAEDLSYAEIAEILGISVSAVKSRLFRGRSMLAEILEGERE
jgi:RNA polymerase sigma-70 factor, ECF subfamily